ncbi:MAG: peptide-methionine (S)-S-oxide reductase MsrA [Verrucomicrobiae bacterium]|nr:peptide-methionine (S)-S-oxide reductase MsrA [Verrucomicrobiae bacterium]
MKLPSLFSRAGHRSLPLVSSILSTFAALAISVSTGQEKDPKAPGPKPSNSSNEVKDQASPANSAKTTAAKENSVSEKADANKGKTAIATFGGGCFWCTEAVMERLEGVVDVKSGYMGGHVDHPTYEQVCQKDTGHVEVIQVTYDPGQITFDDLLDVFWQAHDPTTWDQQGADKGPQYRSVIFTHTPEQKLQAENSKKALNDSGKLSSPVVTEIRDASTFWEAEDYHQDFFKNNPNYGYCRVVISPKLKKLGFE